MLKQIGLHFLTNPRIFLYAIWCFVLEKFISYYLSPLVIPNFRKLDKEHQKAWYNRTVSLVHAVTMFCRAVYYWMVVNKHHIMRTYVSNFEAITIDIMMGYLIYDTIYETSTTADPQVLAHHYIGFFSHLLTRLYDDGSASYYRLVFYSFSFLLLEYVCLLFFK
jgi:hypothetical protein